MRDYSLRNCWRRPVTTSKKDSWCKRPGYSLGKIPKGEAPWGYIVLIPMPNDGLNLKSVNGFIVRAKKACNGCFYFLQVVNVGKKEYPHYQITVKKNPFLKKDSWIINVRNMNKPARRRTGIY